MHVSIKRTLQGLLVASALALTAVGAVTPGEARGGGGHGGGGGSFHGGGGFHGGGYEAHSFHDVHRDWRHGWYGYGGGWGGGYACDSYLADPPYCPTYTY